MINLDEVKTVSKCSNCESSALNRTSLYFAGMNSWFKKNISLCKFQFYFFPYLPKIRFWGLRNKKSSNSGPSYLSKYDRYQT
jgi:hypothetical protein